MWVVGIGLALLPVYLWVLQDLAADLFFNAFVAAVLAVGVVAVSRLPRHRSAWGWILGGQILFLVGDLGFTYVTYYTDYETSFTFADYFYLAGYPSTAIGLVLLLRVQGPLKDLGGLVDGAIVAVGSGVFLWVYLIEPTAGDETLSVADRLIGCAYPAGDLLLITIGAQIAVRQLRRGTPFWMLTAALVVMLAADLGYTYQSLYTNYSTGGLLDAGWWVSYLLVVAAAVHPDAFKLSDPLPERDQPRLTVSRLVVLGAITLASPVLLAVRAGLGESMEIPALLGGTMVMFALVVLRLVLVTRELEVSRSRLLHEATHDALTGLSNRVVFADRVEAALARRQPPGSHAAVLCIDLDDFKAVNDSLGHGAGDRLLGIVADRLSALLRPGDTVARLGGDEFAILLESVPVEAASNVARRVIETIGQAVDVGVDLRFFTNASVGIAFGDQSGDVDAVMRDADIAMYLAKRHGKGRFTVFETGMRQHFIERLELRVDLVGALDRGELSVRYQPVTWLDTGKIHGFEALLRWSHPTRGEVQPAQFISIAEESELLVPIGRWVLDEACRQAQAWDSSSDGPEIAVNVNPIQLTDESFVGDVRRALDRSRLAPGRLLLELTESTLSENPDNAGEVLAAVRELGVRVALDDFGSSHTSLERLLQLPVDVVKFDRRFVVSSLAGDLNVLRGLIQFAHDLGIDTVAEGVETSEQLDVLVALGCRLAQGFLFARPMVAADVPRFSADSTDRRRPSDGLVSPTA
jgi:diguanylate cyclase (GGDEF)-like protein